MTETQSFSAGWVLSVAGHLLVLAAVLWFNIAPPRPDDVAPVLVELVELAAPEPPGPPAAEEPVQAAPSVAPSPPQEVIAAGPAPVPAEDAAPTTPEPSDLLSEAQLAGAADADTLGGGGGAGGGGGGGGCNTAQILQSALQRDPMVRGAVEAAGRRGGAVMLWNGDWVRAGDQAGRGLSGVRQAILWALAFAPETCRSRRMRGLVLLSLTDGTRFAIGTDEDWRWSDLLGLRPPAH